MKYTAFLSILFFLVINNLYSQNIVLEVKGNVAQDDSKPVKKGDNLKNSTRLLLRPDASNRIPEIKLLSPKGVCLIRYNDFQSRPHSELFELVSQTIHKNSVATLGTREFTINPSATEQVKLVDSLCQMLGANPGNITEIAAIYINPYCITAFSQPYWKEIGDLLKSKYGYLQTSNTGNLLTAEEYNTIPKMAVVKTREYLPAAVSLKKYCPIPGDQGRFGTCVGWAGAYGTRTISWAVRNNITTTSDITNQAFSPTYIYEQIKSSDDNSCIKGASIYKAVEILKSTGVPFLSDLSYTCNADLNPFRSVALNYTIKDFQALTMSYRIAISAEEFQYNLNNIKNALNQKKPVLASIDCYQSFYGSIWNGVTDKNLGGHAICIIGYDDKFSNGEGAVELLNSWGPYWGNGGFIHVKYADLKKILKAAIAVYDEAKPVPLVPLKKDTVPAFVTDTIKKLTGSFSLLLADGNEMKPVRNETGIRGLRLTTVDEMTYNIQHTYPSGTSFRLQFTSSQPAYIYIIGADSKRSPVAQLFPDPDRNVSALLDFSSEVKVSIPDETQYIQMDETPGDDYLCVIYSKEPLNISAISNSLKNSDKSFVKGVKEALSGSIVSDDEVTFGKNDISFNAASTKHTAVPIFIGIKHQ